jgi:hypothetical protein
MNPYLVVALVALVIIVPLLVVLLAVNFNNVPNPALTSETNTHLNSKDNFLSIYYSNYALITPIYCTVPYPGYFASITSANPNWTNPGYNQVSFAPPTGYKFVEMNVTIINHGYAWFDSDPSPFFVLCDGSNTRYYNSGISHQLAWENYQISSGGSYNGTLVFEVPQSAASFVFGYDVSMAAGVLEPNHTLNVVWSPVS